MLEIILSDLCSFATLSYFKLYRLLSVALQPVSLSILKSLTDSLTNEKFMVFLTVLLVALDSLVIECLMSCLLVSVSLASLIRGQVVTTDGTPLVGVNVSFVKYPQYGYTLTRQDGT